MGTLSRAEVNRMGFAAVGEDVALSDKASFYNCGKISIGNHVRIDDFCVLSAGQGGIKLGDYIHIAVYASIIGGGGVIVEDFCNISSRVSIYSSSDDYSGATMTNPLIPSQYTGVTHADVRLCEHVIVGSGSVVLPGVTLHQGVAVGALSLVNRDCAEFGIYAGTPAKWVRARDRGLLAIERQFRASRSH